MMVEMLQHYRCSQKPKLDIKEPFLY